MQRPHERPAAIRIPTPPKPRLGAVGKQASDGEVLPTPGSPQVECVHLT